jgi:DNA-binding MarR family transcriptional regulator
MEQKQENILLLTSNIVEKETKTKEIAHIEKDYLSVLDFAKISYEELKSLTAEELRFLVAFKINKSFTKQNLIEDLNQSYRQVSRTLRSLEKKGKISVNRKYNPNPNVYHIVL